MPDFDSPFEALRYHVSGKVERGEAEPVVGVYAVFSGRRGGRVLHYSRGAGATLCGLAEGVGGQVVRDGDYRGVAKVCGTCSAVLHSTDGEG